MFNFIIIQAMNNQSAFYPATVFPHLFYVTLKTKATKIKHLQNLVTTKCKSILFECRACWKPLL